MEIYHSDIRDKLRMSLVFPQDGAFSAAFVGISVNRSSGASQCPSNLGCD
jgi:hypothetical protein